MSETIPLDLTGVLDHDLPLRLASLHRELGTGDEIAVRLVDSPHTVDIVHGAGFHIQGRTDHEEGTDLRLERCWELPDHVGPELRILMVGLNPSPTAADTGIGFAGPSNRFWPALLEAGLATVDRDPVSLVADHRIGMTDLVRRTTATAAELTHDDYSTGFDRLERLASWLEPGVVCVLGLQGWRSVMGRRVTAGRQPSPLGGHPVYLMPNPSGLNANHQLPDFVEHLLVVAAIAEQVE